MKRIFLALLLLTGSYIVSKAQQINDGNAEKRSVGSFHGIEVGTGVELFLTQGNAEEVAVSASSTKFRDKLVAEVVNGILKIRYDTKTGSVNKKKESKELKAYVSYKVLDLLDASTGAEVKIQGVLHSSSLKMKVNTGATAEGQVNIGKLEIDQSTGSKVTLSGKAETLSVGGSTGSRFTGEGMETINCNAKVSTGARVTVSAEKELQAKASTGGIIKYKGSASIREIKTNTGGSVSKI
jgi:Putative auto-transporter adhesin, head GIN domain